MDVKEKFDLVTRNLQEVIGEGELLEKLSSKKPLRVYWGTATTGSPSVAYFFPMLKVADLLKAGCSVKILLADLHGMLDGTPADILEKRYKYYVGAISLILKTIGVDLKNLEFVKGSELQLQPGYMKDLLHLSTLTSVHDATRASSEVVKQSDNPKLAGPLYPLMQALDEQYLGVDAQLGGVDQRKILVFAREFLPKIGYGSRIELMNPMIRGLIGDKMSSSDRSSKIDLVDSSDDIKRAIKKADCAPGDLDNGLLPLVKYLLIPLQGKFVIDRPEKFGGRLEYDSYNSVESDFSSEKLHPLDLKNAVADALIDLLKPFRDSKNLLKLYEEAYA